MLYAVETCFATLSPMDEPDVIQKAEFNSKVCGYWLISGMIVCVVTIIGIPFVIPWMLVGMIFTKRYLDRMECVLTTKTLEVKKGILVRVEKTVPLEKITDMGMVQGPIMRSMNLHKLTVETAGQSGPGSLLAITGIVGAKEFREKVLKQRDVLAASASSSAAPSAAAGGDGLADPRAAQMLADIRETLLRIEGHLKKGE